MDGGHGLGHLFPISLDQLQIEERSMRRLKYGNPKRSSFLKIFLSVASSAMITYLILTISWMFALFFLFIPVFRRRISLLIDRHPNGAILVLFTALTYFGIFVSPIFGTFLLLLLVLAVAMVALGSRSAKRNADVIRRPRLLGMDEDWR
jgi:hypothetical protein